MAQPKKEESETEPQIPLVILVLTSLFKCMPLILIYGAVYLLFKAQREIILIFAAIPFGIFAIWKNKNIIGYVLGRKVDGNAVVDVIIFFCLLLGLFALIILHLYLE